MKVFIAIISLFFGGIGLAFAEPQTVTLDIKNMTCALCPLTVHTAIKNVNGVVSVQVDFKRKTARVSYDDCLTNTVSVAAASTDAGYPAVPQQGE